MQYSRDRLGELLVRADVITEEQLESALAYQREHGGKIGQILVASFGLQEETIAQVLAGQKGLEYINLMFHAVDREAASLMPARTALRSHAIPVEFRGDTLVLAMANPLDIEAIDGMRLRSGLEILPAVSTPAQIEYAIEKYIASADAFGSIIAEDEALPHDDIDVPEDDVPVVRLVSQIIREAVLDSASDIHIEPGPQGVRVRYRVDGVLHEVMRAPSSARSGMTSRVKVMAEMDISERRRPQDGRIQLSVNDRLIDMRVATLPTPFGETIVIRILNSQATHQTVTDLGMSAAHRAQFERFLSMPYGEILISGPTGSGKSTTLYAGLTHLNSPTRKIITIEDPIEYQIDGITQMAAHAAIGLTFANLLRTVLRADPDVIMVGEIRDAETAQIATRAALTGHLVLSSIHTNDAPSALTRLSDMEVAPFVASGALIGVVAQRLVRKLCPACKREVQVTGGLLIQWGLRPGDLSATTIYAPGEEGCNECLGTGYRGRLGVFEIMEMTPEIERLFLASAPSEEMRVAALASGMKTLKQDALDKVSAGLTSLEEVTRVVG